MQQPRPVQPLGTMRLSQMAACEIQVEGQTRVKYFAYMYTHTHTHPAGVFMHVCAYSSTQQDARGEKSLPNQSAWLPAAPKQLNPT